jgi:hypothetical protein
MGGKAMNSNQPTVQGMVAPGFEAVLAAFELSATFEKEKSSGPPALSIIEASW